MKATIIQNHLEKGLSAITRITQAKAQLPILANILLHAQKGELLLGATNLHESMRLVLPTTVDEEGQLTIPGKLLYEFVHLLPNKPVEMTETNHSLHVASENAKADFAGIAASEFPKIPSFDMEPLFTLPVSLLEEMVSHVSFAASKDESRPHLTGVLCKLTDQGLEMVATDGFRLSYMEKAFKHPAGEQTMLLPAKYLEELIRLAKEFSTTKDQNIEFALLEDQNQVIARIGMVEYASRLLEGKFPDYEKVIPQDSTTVVTVNRADLLNAIRLAAVFSRDGMSVIKMEVGSNFLTISSDAKEIGNDVIKVDASVEGDTCDIAFNPRFFLELLQNLDTENILVELSGSLSPALFRLKPNGEFLHVIMPVRT